MWVCRYGSGSLYVHIEDGWRASKRREGGEPPPAGAP